MVSQVHMVWPGQARLVTGQVLLATDLLERTIPLVLTLQTWPIKPIPASTATWVCWYKSVDHIWTATDYILDGNRHGHRGPHEDIIHGGPHHTETANKLDPHVSGSGRTEHTHIPSLTGTTGSGLGKTDHSTTHGETSTTSTGPHKSGLLNKLDPRWELYHSKEDSLLICVLMLI